ncbi:MAG: hypothetical protein H6948_06550 [Zoogloeaceae bacterium]|nr:hypothetical protein [Zoogloeaceae bacterium]
MSEMERPLSYRIGRFIGRLPLLGRVLLLTLIVGFVWWVRTEPERQRKAEAEALAQAAAVAEQRASATAAAEAARLKGECESGIQSTLVEYADLISKGKPREAANSIRRCASALQDAALKHKVAAAEIAAYSLVINNPQVSPRKRIASIGEFASNYPEEAKKFAALRASLEAQASRMEEKQARADRKRDLARRKRQGVSIGMSQEEVLQSSWGRPERSNRSIYSFGTREQWVYGGGNYLYFEDGMLTSIQTGGSR